MTTAAEFVEALRALKASCGLSLRELQRRSGLPRSTIAHALDQRRASLPPWERVDVLLLACGLPEASRQEWQQAWSKILRGAAPAATRRWRYLALKPGRVASGPLSGS